MAITSLPNFPSTEAEVKDILTEGSYLMFEFKDKEVYSTDDNGEIETDSLDNPYTKLVSPVYASEIINEENNQELLDIIFGEVPFYHLAPSLPRTAEDEEFLSLVRDAGLNDVPAPMQNSFWSSWFRDSQGYIQNLLLLDVYNKLRFPYVNENLYLNAMLFPELAENAFNYSSGNSSLIEFNYTTEDNANDIANGDIGCVDYIEDIIDQKLDSTYDILNYNPDMSMLLSDWGDSLYYSGQLDESEVEREKTIFKLQDVKYELLRRKFGGSSTLYNLSYSSIGRQGSFIGVIPAGKLNNNVEVFKDQRLIRIVDIPGILSTNADLTDNNPIEAFYTRPLEDGETYIPLGLILPLFYSSSDQGLNSQYPYNAEDFLLTGTEAIGSLNALNVTEYQNLFLRDNSTILNWDELSGILSEDSINVYYPKLDEKVNDKYRTMDSDFVATDGTTSPMRLDIEIPYFSMASVSGNFLDITANHLLYHSNTLQDNLGDAYPYLTYPIAEGNSVSLMDIPWIDYLNSCTKNKSRVQDAVYFGAQINRYSNFSDPQVAEEIFFAITYDDEDKDSFDTENFTDFYSLDHFDHRPRYAYLWYITLQYDILSFQIVNTIPILFSKITLRIDTDNYQDIDIDQYDEEFSDIDTWLDLRKLNLGVLPITYKEISYNNATSYLKLGLRKVENIDGEGSASKYEFIDTLNDLGYSKAFYVFSDSDLISDRVNFSGSDPSIGMSPFSLSSNFTEDPTIDTKTVYFGIIRTSVKTTEELAAEENINSGISTTSIVTSSQNSNLNTRYIWSDPIRVININEEFMSSLENTYYYPDWYRLLFHINPYLNFNAESASALRHRKLIGSIEIEDLSSEDSVKDELLIGPSEYAALCSQSCTRGYDFTLNDNGSLDDLDSSKPYGFYFENFKQSADNPDLSYRNREFVEVYGDNRFKDIFDRNNPTSGSINRSQLYYDDNEMNCLMFTEGNYYNTAISGYDEIIHNYYEINPFRTQDYRLGNDAGGKAPTLDDWDGTIDEIWTKEISHIESIENGNSSTEEVIVDEESTNTNFLVSDVYDKWYWNEPNDGISAFLNIKFSEEGLGKNGEAYVVMRRDDEGNQIYDETTGKPLYDIDLSQTTLDESQSSPLLIERKGTSTDKVDSEFSLRLISSLNGDNIETKFRLEFYPLGNSNQVLFIESDAWSETNSSDKWQLLTDISTVSDGLNSARFNTSIPELTNYNTRIGFSIYTVGTYTEENSYNTVNLTLIINNSVYTKVYQINKTSTENVFEAICEETGENIELDNTTLKFTYRPDAAYLNADDNFIPGYPIKYFKDSRFIIKGISLFSDKQKDENGDIEQFNMFFGNLYDLRLYNVGMDANSLYLHNIGLIREQYSYAPSTYKLAYSIYRDFGIYKPVKGIPVTAGNITPIHSIRLFDRTVWDSILTDMYPISVDEMEPTAPQYDEYAKDPRGDTDIYDENSDLVCIEQDLIDTSEVTNNRHPNATGGNGNLLVQYRNEFFTIDSNDWATIITTSLYPVYYKNVLFDTNAELNYSVDEDGNLVFKTPDLVETGVDSEGNTTYRPGMPIDIPVYPVGNTLKYNTDLSLNFVIEPKSDLSVYYSRGNNIELIYNTLLEKSTIRLSNTSIRSSSDNHVLIPVTIPAQTEIGGNTQGKLDRFNLIGIQFNNGLETFLKATTYYNEMRVPIAMNDSLDGTPYYINRWDAIRTLKEGTYYFTVKYPLQILPFMDYEYNTLSSGKFATLYGSARFKIEVKGTSIPYNPEDYALTGYPSQYLRSNLVNTLTSGKSLYDPEDNRTFPHRRIDIDFYVLDSGGVVGSMSTDYVENYRFRWKKIGSNWDTGADIQLSRETLNSSIGTELRIPLFLQKNYTSPFFVAKYEKGNTNPNPLSADDDTILPITIIPNYSETSLAMEKLTIETEEDLDSLVLIAGKSYKLLFDYSAQVSEISFTDTFFEGEEETVNVHDPLNNSIVETYKAYSISQDEIKNYSRLTSLIDSDTVTTDYLYGGSTPWYAKSDVRLTAKTSGFDVDEFGNWQPVTTDVSSDVFYFGNPYSRASTNNYILYRNQNNRQEVDNLAYFPYITREVITANDDGTISSPYIIPATYMSTINVVENRYSASVYTMNSISINENSILSTLWNTLKNRVNSAIGQLRSNVSGLITNLSEIEHNITYDLTGTGLEDEVINQVSIIKADEYELFGYYASDRSISSRNDNIIITRRGVYSNNLIKNKNFLNSVYWLNSTGGRYVSDLTWDNGVGKDVFRFDNIGALSSNDEGNRVITMRYLSGSQVYSAAYEAAINVMIRDRGPEYTDYSDKLEIIVHYLRNGNETASLTLNKTDVSQKVGDIMAMDVLEDPDAISWYIYSGELSEQHEADSVIFEFIIKDITDETVDLFITKPVIRRSTSTSHKLGLSDALYNMSTSDEQSKVACVSHRIVIFRNNTTLEPVPIQFKNNINSYSASNTDLSRNNFVESGQSRVADFIKSCSLGKSTESSKLENLFKPWVRRMFFWDRKQTTDTQYISNCVQFYKYRVSTDSMGIKSKAILRIPTNDIFTTKLTPVLDDEGNPVYNEEGNPTYYSALDYDATGNEIIIRGLVMKLNGGKFLSQYNTNLRLYSEDPMELIDERFTALTNCFNPSRYKQGLSNPIAITNIQLIGEQDEASNIREIVYEFEYLPVIYDELDQHISLNFIIHKSV